MRQAETFRRTPLTVIVESHEGSARSIQRMLSGEGYAVLRAYTCREALDLLERVRPDVALVGETLPDGAGVDLCQRMRHSSGMRSSTPILMTTERRLSAAARAEAHEAGVWALLSRDVGAEELATLLETLVRAKQDADLAREESLVDPDTGFYNVRGILRRASEVSADAVRSGRPVACVVVGLEADRDDSSTTGEDRAPLTDELALALTGALRTSDTVGRLGERDYVILAPGTGPGGASRLAERLLARIDQTGMGRGKYVPGFRAGYYAVSDLHDRSIIPVDLLTRATLALRKAQEDASRLRIHAFPG